MANAYERIKNERNKSNALNYLTSKEEVYWGGAGAISMLLFGFIDGGASVAIAYGAKKLYDKKSK